MSQPDPDRLARRAFDFRMSARGINQIWEKLPDYRRDYWREWVADVKPAFEEEMLAAAMEMNDG